MSDADLAARGAIQALQREHQKLKNRLEAAERRIGELEARTGDDAPEAENRTERRLSAFEADVNRLYLLLRERSASSPNIGEPVVSAIAEGNEARLSNRADQVYGEAPEGWPRKHGKHGPFYQLSDGRKVRGKEAAEAAQAELDVVATNETV